MKSCEIFIKRGDVFICSICNHTVKFKSFIERHVRNHTKNVVKYEGKAIYRCNMKCYGREGSHYHCPFCKNGKSFRRRADLQHHLEINKHVQDGTFHQWQGRGKEKSKSETPDTTKNQGTTKRSSTDKRKTEDSEQFNTEEGKDCNYNKETGYKSGYFTADNSPLNSEEKIDEKSPKKDIFNDEGASRENVKPFNERVKQIGKRAPCPICKRIILARNVARHIMTQHPSEPKYPDYVSNHTYLECYLIDIASGIYLVKGNTNGNANPIHVRKDIQIGRGISSIMCEDQLCRMASAASARHLASSYECEHLQSTRYYTEPMYIELDLSILKYIVDDIQWVRKDMMSPCQARLENAMLNNIPAVVMVQFKSGVQPNWHFSVYEPASKHYSILQRTHVCRQFMCPISLCVL